jgi:uncharacterized protein YyaL (SSP411 family)
MKPDGAPRRGSQAAAASIRAHHRRRGGRQELGSGTALEDISSAAADEFEADFDAEHGGFGGAPKFPSPHNLMFLLRFAKRTGNARSLHMVEETLEAMRRGGIRDHLGGGFHRYATDARWLVPHFEKMLYDQALLAMAYLEAYQATGRTEFARTARETLDYVLRDLSSPEGGFYAAEDADSEGEEGKFYLWTMDEVSRALSPADADLAARAFGLKPEGNFQDPIHPGGRENILHEERKVDSGFEFRLTNDQVERRLADVAPALRSPRGTDAAAA